MPKGPGPHRHNSQILICPLPLRTVEECRRVQVWAHDRLLEVGYHEGLIQLLEDSFWEEMLIEKEEYL